MGHSHSKNLRELWWDESSNNDEKKKIMEILVSNVGECIKYLVSTIEMGMIND